MVDLWGLRKSKPSVWVLKLARQVKVHFCPTAMGQRAESTQGARACRLQKAAAHTAGCGCLVHVPETISWPAVSSSQDMRKSTQNSQALIP